MHWYLIHTKPRQEQCALLNLERQGYECFMPLITVERLRRGRLSYIDEPLFPRYLFIHLGTAESDPSWSPIRSTLGVSRMVAFGTEPARVDDAIIEALRSRSQPGGTEPEKMFAAGEKLLVTEGPFAGLEAVYQMNDGESRVMVLIELLNKSTPLRIEPAKLRKAG